MEISVIIPTFKPDDYIFKCLDSLSNQTFNKTKFEVIIILNGCNEPYRKKIELYIEEDNNTSWLFLHTDIAGVSNARNIGLKYAKGKFVTFIDDDDYVSPTYLSDLYAKSSEDSLVFALQKSFTIQNNSLIDSKNENVFLSLIKRRKISINRVRSLLSGPCAKLIPKNNVIAERRFFSNMSLGEDTIFMFLISDRVKDFRLASTSAIYYRSVRKESAVNIPRTSIFLFHNCIKQLNYYFSIYFKKPFDYNFLFFLTRCGGAIYGPIRKQLAKRG